MKGQISDRYQEAQAEISKPGTVVSLMSARYQRHARHLAQVCERYDVPFLDLTPAIRELEADGPALYWSYDNHLRPRGNRAIARVVYDWWRADTVD